MQNRYLLLLILSFQLISCNNHVTNVEKAVYLWSSDISSHYGNSSHYKFQKIYHKFFEIDYNDAMGCFPFAKNQPNEWEYREDSMLKIIPVIYIKNDIYKFTKEKDLDKLAENIIFLINKYKDESKLKPLYEEEIQIDCDWTQSTKDKYFYLLKKIDDLYDGDLSCTLRLYPYKYSNVMGVPPVDKVMLMCYNLTHPLQDRAKNSIFDITEFKKYLDVKKSYPKHVDIALPVFFWSLHFQNGQFLKSIPLSSKMISSFTKPTKPLWYEVTKDTVVDYYSYLRKGDQIKCEEVSAETIDEITTILKKNLSLDSKITVCLFRLDDGLFYQYDNEEINTIYNSFLGK